MEAVVNQSQDQLLALIARTAQGNQLAFKELYELTAPHLYAIALGVMKEQSLAEDVLQETFVQVWHRASDYHGERGKVITWLSSILRYRAIDAIRRKKKFSHADVDDIEVVDDSPQDQPASQLFAVEDAGRLENCLDTLAGSQRMSITLAYYQGLTHQELSHHLETPLGTIKSRIRRGLTRLKECLEL